MRLIALSLLALLLVPATAAGKDANAPVRALWNSSPENVGAGGTWDARLSVLQGPGGLYGGHARPVIIVTSLASHAERRVPMGVDVPPNTFRANVTFPRAGLYEVAVGGFDPRDPERFIDIGPPVRIEPTAAAANATGASWPWGPTVGAAIAVLLAGAATRSRRSGSLPFSQHRRVHD
jgi:hypothetical protein